MFEWIKRFWQFVNEADDELAKQGIYYYTNQFGQPIYIDNRAYNDRQKTNQRPTKKSKR